MAKNIIFTNTSGHPEIDPPIPASKLIPEWYKDTESYMGGSRKPFGNGVTSGTIKRCVPVFDAITSGYLITLPADIYISQKDGAPWYEWSNFDLLQFHLVEQALNYPTRNGMPQYPKFVNHWSIETPRGYSCMFVQPLHRESVFTILAGVVDTDTYTAPVNFPFVLNDPKFEGLIPCGTPIVQVIPFKRDGWASTLGDDIQLQKVNSLTKVLRKSFFDSYKTRYWFKKEYK